MAEIISSLVYSSNPYCPVLFKISVRRILEGKNDMDELYVLLSFDRKVLNESETSSFLKNARIFIVELNSSGLSEVQSKWTTENQNMRVAKCASVKPYPMFSFAPKISEIFGLFESS